MRKSRILEILPLNSLSWKWMDKQDRNNGIKNRLANMEGKKSLGGPIHRQKTTSY